MEETKKDPNEKAGQPVKETKQGNENTGQPAETAGKNPQDSLRKQRERTRKAAGGS